MAGILILPAVYILFRMLYNKWTGLIAMALVVSSSHLITYSTNARGYSTQALLVLLLIISAITIKRGHDNLKMWAVFIGLGTLCFYTLPTTLYFFGAVALWLLLSALAGDTVTRKKKFIINLATACLLTGLLTVLLYIPVILTEGMGAITSNPWVRPLPISILFNSTGTLLLDTWRIWNLAIPLAVSVILAIGFLVSII